MTIVSAPEITDEEILANRAKWTAALRSGEYAQGKDQLATSDYTAYCCLGVACEVLGEKYGVRRDYHTFMSDETFYSWDNPEYVEDENERNPYVLDDAPVFREFGELPAPLFAALGLSGDDQTVLTAMNDSYDNSFTEIADYVDGLPIYREQ